MALIEWFTAERLSVVAALASALAAGLAWRTARYANRIATRANETADRVAQLERDRWRFDLRTARPPPGRHRPVPQA